MDSTGVLCESRHPCVPRHVPVLEAWEATWVLSAEESMWRPRTPIKVILKPKSEIQLKRRQHLVTIRTIVSQCICQHISGDAWVARDMHIARR